MRKATFSQFLQIGSLIDNGTIGRELAQALIEGRVSIKTDTLAKPAPNPHRSAPEVSSTLPPDHYRVHITYDPIPSIAALKKDWGKKNVCVIYDGRTFKLHASCQGMDRTPGEKVFYIHDAGDDWESEERIAWGLKQRSAIAPNGYRPATHEETYEFAQAHPELVDFVGLGSSAMGVARRFVACVWRDCSRRILDSDGFDCRWLRRHRVLFVCK